MIKFFSRICYFLLGAEEYERQQNGLIAHESLADRFVEAALEFIVVRIAWDLSGLHLIATKFFYSSAEPRPPSVGLWVISVYITAFTIASSIYQTQYDALWNKLTTLAAIASTGNYQTALLEVGRLQTYTLPVEPRLREPLSIVRSYFREYNAPSDYVLHETIRIVGFAGFLDPETRKRTLSGTTFVKWRLAEASFYDVDLSNSSFYQTDLTRSLFDRAILTKTQIFESVLIDSHWRSSDLSNAYFRDTNLCGANLHSANMSGVWARHSNFTDARLYGADLSNADLWLSVLNRTDLRHANLSRALVRQEDINQAYGDENTKLPDGIQRPPTWSNSQGAGIPSSNEVRCKDDQEWYASVAGINTNIINSRVRYRCNTDTFIRTRCREEVIDARTKAIRQFQARQKR